MASKPLKPSTIRTMKNLIIIIGTIVLGALIFNMMVGPGEETYKSAVKEQMINSTLNVEGNYE